MTKQEIVKEIDRVIGDIRYFNAAEHMSRDDQDTVRKLEKRLDLLGMYLRKADFVEMFKGFYLLNTENSKGITDIEYQLLEENGLFGEVVVVYFDDSHKRFSVKSDSKEAIMKDFCSFLKNFDDYEWEME